LIERGVRLAIESGRPVRHVAADLGIDHETLRKAVRQAEADGGLRPDLPSTLEREQIKALRKENYELRRANDILKAARCFRDRARPRPAEVTAFIDGHRERFGVEPICRTLGVSASADYTSRHWRALSSPA
jgi:transposase